jgi:cytochrome c peroxidase
MTCRTLSFCLTIVIVSYLVGDALAQESACSNERPSVFSWEPILLPKPSNLCDFIKDEAAAIELGKALFWDMQTGSDGLTACATCHFHAGVDNRTKNQLSPKGAPESQEPGAAFEVGAPNATVTASDFPFHKLQDPEDRFSAVLSDSNDVMSSQGVFRTGFVDIVPGRSEEEVTVIPDPVFNVGGINTRRVEPRNSMNIINAVFNIEQFWDGRGKFYFNGVNTHGLLDENARILEKQGEALDADVVRVKVEIDMASLASQATGPPLSSFEMSAENRPLPKIGKKLLNLIPLGKQVVHPTDSVLGALSRDDGSLTISGLGTTYVAMIQAAFHEKYWNSNKLFDLDQNLIGAGAPANTDQFTLMEMNFSLFWGLAIQLYESTLVSDDSPFDRFMAGDESALTAEEQRGMELFFHDRLNCFRCHAIPEINKATINHLVEFPEGRINGPLERMTMAAGGPHADTEAIYDGGFYNIGARPTAEDMGRGGTAHIGEGEMAIEQPLSFTQFALLNGEAALRIPSRQLKPPLQPDEVAVVNGAMRVPTLRNVELTGPYYHNGALATLADVVLFYTRGGDFREQNIEFFDPAVGSGSDEFLKGRPDHQRALAKFMARPLTDDRVRYQRAPFDHPELFVPNGHPGDRNTVTDDGTGRATDELMRVPPVGAAGSETPLSTFLNLSPEEPSR